MLHKTPNRRASLVSGTKRVGSEKHRFRMLSDAFGLVKFDQVSLNICRAHALACYTDVGTNVSAPARLVAGGIVALFPAL